MRALVVSDQVAGGVARAAATLGQAALVCLGVHLAADSLDDRVLDGFMGLQAWADGALTAPHATVGGWFGMPPGALIWWDELPLAPVAGTLALILEFATDALLITSFLLTPRAPKLAWTSYKRALSMRAVVMPLALAGVLIAGAWSLAMAAEDLLPHSAVAPWAGGLLGLAALGRMGAPAWFRAVAALEPPKKWTDGLVPALGVIPLGVLAWVHGVPVWGWLP
jgi:hypothetical protein